MQCLPWVISVCSLGTSPSVMVQGSSGVMITTTPQRSWGVTAAHIADKKSEEVVIRFSDLTRRDGKWVRIDLGRDLALFSVDGPSEVAPVSLEPAWAAASSVGQVSGMNELAYSKQVSIEGLQRSLFTVTSGPKNEVGDSGGGIFHGGRLAHVISHLDRKRPDWVYASPHHDLLAFLSDAERAEKISLVAWSDRRMTQEIMDLKVAVEKLRKQVDELSLRSPVSGEPGPQGERGPAGPGVDDMLSRINDIEAWKRNLVWKFLVRVEEKKAETK